MSSPVPFRALFVAALVLGTGAAIYYASADLTLSHYDAKAHLVVARRIIDSLRPGWWQVGAVWLPLPHLLNMLPVQIDWLYRTGLSGVAISVVCFAVASATIGWLVGRSTGSAAGALAGTVIFASQPDVLYLQSTPMTEPLLMALTLAGVALTWRWTAEGGTGSVHAPGALLALACWTRYEAWPITAAAVALALLVLIWNGERIGHALRRVLPLAAWPIAAGLAFLVLSRATVGEWLVTGGFYVIENPDYHRPFKPLGSVFWGVRQLNGTMTVSLGVAALAVLAWGMVRSRAHRPLLVVLSLAACAALPYYAFYSGHPFRIRYMTALTMVLACVVGLGVGLLPRGRAVVAAIVALVALVETPAFSPRAPMVLEAQWDRPRSFERRTITRCLADGRDGTPILASMGSLAHYMQETSHAGFQLRDYIHEGIGQIWIDSLRHPSRHAGWVLIEEQAEGGDMLARLRAQRPGFLADFERACEAGGVALYRRITSR
ncbi:MAG TPA: hypothetical protein VIL35_08870 [Vicinamibacterales bacterium]